MIKLKRAYDPVSDEDGRRILVDRLWPRGVSKEKGAIDRWAKELAPSTELRKWFAHDPKKWPEFQKKYKAELATQTDELKQIAHEARDGSVTLIFAARDEEHNEAVVLKGMLDQLVHNAPGHRTPPSGTLE